MSIVLLLLTLLPAQISLTGTWTMDRVKSDFGRADAPKAFVLHIEQTDNHLSATVFSADDNEERVSYRECRLEAQPDNALSCLMPDGVVETWQLVAADELKITRVVAYKSHPTRQRLVLARSTRLE